MPQRQGSRTNATLRHNEFEHKANRGDFIIEKNSGVPFSLSKSKRWELLNEEDNPLPIRKTIPAHMESNSRRSPFWHVGFPGGHFVDFDRARQYQTVNGKRSTIQLEQQETINEWIDLSFKTNEYPLKRELYKNHCTPCKACLNRGGVILFRGRGKKSSTKTKGMKSYHRKDWQDEFNL